MPVQVCEHSASLCSCFCHDERLWGLGQTPTRSAGISTKQKINACLFCIHSVCTPNSALRILTISILLPAIQNINILTAYHMQVFASEANIGDGPELGHIGSARNLAKLNVVSPAVFPLPAAMTAPSGEDIHIPEDPEEPDSVAGAENGVEEIAVALDTDSLLQIRVQGIINAGRFFAVSIISVTGMPYTLDRQMCPLQCCKWHFKWHLTLERHSNY